MVIYEKKQLKSFYPKKDSLKDSWVVYDANEKILGRAASDISSLVLGKYSPTYTPGAFNHQYVVVINADKIKVTGRKLTDKKYYRHSGYPGGLKETTLEKLMDRKPTEALKKAVNGMFLIILTVVCYKQKYFIMLEKSINMKLNNQYHL